MSILSVIIAPENGSPLKSQVTPWQINNSRYKPLLANSICQNQIGDEFGDCAKTHCIFVTMS